jgi:hypothetical protein
MHAKDIRQAYNLVVQRTNLLEEIEVMKDQKPSEYVELQYAKLRANTMMRAILADIEWVQRELSILGVKEFESNTK